MRLGGFLLCLCVRCVFLRAWVCEWCRFWCQWGGRGTRRVVLRYGGCSLRHKSHPKTSFPFDELRARGQIKRAPASKVSIEEVRGDGQARLLRELCLRRH